MIDSRWPVDIQRLTPHVSPDDQKRLVEGKSISLVKYAESHWHPQLYIENALGDLKEQVRYTAKKSKEDQQIYICEHRDVKGVFWEKLELHHFPSDVQDLSISIGSTFRDDKVLLLRDPHHLSGVNREAFVDQQKWSLYEHVDTQQRSVKEFLFRGAINAEDDEEDDPLTESEDRRQSVLTITCHAGKTTNQMNRRRSLMFSSSSIDVFLLEWILFDLPDHCGVFLHLWHSTSVSCLLRDRLHSCFRFSLSANRIQIVCLLLLTSITFRWTVNRSLVSVAGLCSESRMHQLSFLSLADHLLFDING